MISFRHVKLVIIFSSLMFIFMGCTAATRSRMMVDGMKPMMEKMNIAVNQNPDVETVRRAMPASLVQLDGFIEVSPDNEDLLLRASEAYGGYAFLFIEDTDKKRAAKLNKKARDYALRVLNINWHLNTGWINQMMNTLPLLIPLPRKMPGHSFSQQTAGCHG